MIIASISAIQIDHYQVTFLEHPLEVNVMVQDYTWPGGLVVLQFVAENPGEFVVECRGWDEYES